MGDKNDVKTKTKKKASSNIPPDADENVDKKDVGDREEDIIKSLNEELEAKKKEAEDSYERLQRVSADFENYKKRTSREMEDFRKFANETLLEEILTVADNLERAIEAASDKKSADDKKDGESGVLKGVDLTLAGVFKIFEKFNVKQLKSVGEPFDPSFHQAIMREKNDGYPENTVIKEAMKGYTIHDRLLRPAMVVVSETSGDKIKEEK